MIVGLLSDTHGHVKRTRRAVSMLRDNGAEILLHCGDVGDLAVLDELVGSAAVFVFGNNDLDHARLIRYAAGLGITCGMQMIKVPLGDKQAVITHGDDGSAVRKVLREQAVDYLFMGHTHEPTDYRDGKIRIINPGALHRAAERTIAVLDTTSDVLKFLVVPRGDGVGRPGLV